MLQVLQFWGESVNSGDISCETPKRRRSSDWFLERREFNFLCAPFSIFKNEIYNREMLQIELWV